LVVKLHKHDRMIKNGLRIPHILKLGRVYANRNRKMPILNIARKFDLKVRSHSLQPVEWLTS